VIGKQDARWPAATDSRAGHRETLTQQVIVLNGGKTDTFARESVTFPSAKLWAGEKTAAWLSKHHQVLVQNHLPDMQKLGRRCGARRYNLLLDWNMENRGKHARLAPQS
jgi:hypothetical protein